MMIRHAVALLAFLFFSAELWAQNFDQVGIDSSTDEQYECVRFGDPSLNTILVTKLAEGKQINLSIKGAKKRVKKQVRRNIRVRNNFREKRSRVNQELRALNNSLVPNQKKKKKLRAKAAEYEAKIQQHQAYISILKELINGISRCTKDAPLSGDLKIISGIYHRPGSSYIPEEDPDLTFYALLIYEVSKYPSGGSVCAQIDGGSDVIEGMSNSTSYPWPYVNDKSVSNLCIKRNRSADCVERHPFYAFSISGAGGTLNPGTCGTATPWRCSLEAAIARLTVKMNEMRVNLLGLPGSRGTCSQDVTDY
ncbi:MAG: hypothetical protein KDD64_03655 [Bdellovibrionales bacterium]|nr:hypothetical protein [Bdellovibrionales bacterium]